MRIADLFDVLRERRSRTIEFHQRFLEEIRPLWGDIPEENQ